MYYRKPSLRYRIAKAILIALWQTILSIAIAIVIFGLLVLVFSSGFIMAGMELPFPQ